MKPRKLIGSNEMSNLFDWAVQERALAVLTLQNGEQWESFKSRFLERDPRGRFFVLDYLPNDHEALPALSPGQYLGVSFRHRSRKLLFATVVEARGHFLVDDQSSIPAVRYRWPESLTELQRRSYQRTPVPAELRLLVSLWAGGLAARSSAQQDALQVMTGQLVDLSCGGAAVRLHGSTPPSWIEDQTLGVELQLPDGRTPLLLEARYRGVRHDDTEGWCAAIQFVGLEVTVDGRGTLQRLAAAVQRLYRVANSDPKQVRESS